MRAIFDVHASKNLWKMEASVLKSYSEYFGARTEHLDFYYDGGRMILTSYTEKITSGAGLLDHHLRETLVD